MRTDTLFYRLFQERPTLVFELAGWSCPADADYRWRSEEIKMILELQETDLKQTRFCQEVFAEGREEGRNQGRTEGLDEGRRTEARTLVMRLVRRRFGVVAPAVEAKISALSLSRLEALAEELLGFQDREAPYRWLERL